MDVLSDSDYQHSKQSFVRHEEREGNERDHKLFLYLVYFPLAIVFHQSLVYFSLSQQTFSEC